ncbi:hypothetical protein E2C01_010905 [Portunus trituberculatus]|uniref:Uncharacterized protein n=1 Tax=Portunus trituberculatus TaxID=210409 RepID=A0A5B7D9M2_PORTR|nr:hypothetical protein [Portunus trituberculatus]
MESCKLPLMTSRFSSIEEAVERKTFSLLLLLLLPLPPLSLTAPSPIAKEHLKTNHQEQEKNQHMHEKLNTQHYK